MSAGFEIAVLDAPVADTALNELASVRADWTHAGIIPDDATSPDGWSCDTAIMWKRVER